VPAMMKLVAPVGCKAAAAPSTATARPRLPVPAQACSEARRGGAAGVSAWAWPFSCGCALAGVGLARQRWRRQRGARSAAAAAKTATKKTAPKAKAATKAKAAPAKGKQPEEALPDADGDAEVGKLKKQEKLARLRKLLKSKDSKPGDNRVFFLGETSSAAVETCSTGCLSLDVAMGGGWPKGRIVEIYGPEASGKTTLAYHAMAQVQKAGGLVAYVDVEHAIDPDYARTVGVNVDELAFNQPDSAEKALDLVEELAVEGALDLIVVDSVAALVPEEEMAKDMGESTIGLLARLMSKALRKITPVAYGNGCTIMFINQLRASINPYGPPEVTSGGNALKYYASVRVEIRAPKGGLLKRAGEEDPYGIEAKTKITKNKCAPPHKTAKFDIIFGSGISQESSILDAALAAGIVEKAGAWLQYKDLKLQGKEKFVQHVKNNPDLCSELERTVKEHLEAPKETADAA